MLFDKSVYIERRRLLKQRIGSGIILLMGNNDSPANYPSNVYRFRQDSSFLYFYGLHREGLAGIIDVGTEAVRPVAGRAGQTGRLALVRC